MREMGFFAAILLLSIGASADVNWREDLKKDAVRIEGDRMMMEEYYLINYADELGNARSAQVKMYSEAVNDGTISRDNFVGFGSTLSAMFLAAIGSDFEYIEAPIGRVDLEISIYMTGQGYQIEVKDNTTNTANRETQTWEKLYAK